MEQRKRWMDRISSVRLASLLFKEFTASFKSLPCGYTCMLIHEADLNIIRTRVSCPASLGQVRISDVASSLSRMGTDVIE